MDLATGALMLWDAAIAALVWFAYRKAGREIALSHAQRLVWFLLMTLPCVAVIMVPIVAEPGPQPGWERVNQFLTTPPAMAATLSLVTSRQKKSGK